MTKRKVSTKVLTLYLFLMHWQIRSELTFSENNNTFARHCRSSLAKYVGRADFAWHTLVFNIAIENGGQFKLVGDEEFGSRKLAIAIDYVQFILCFTMRLDSFALIRVWGPPHLPLRNLHAL